ncbi:hypothetical protein ARMGADRAFT_114556 [Armillaria gallica]|uniref:Protein kinase domain-containing protein n=1 Tax=Armillaria gallica TaxID=47427 RepID=A0A2H3DJK5_ARMGA|nr:hypothetical protein ARMGADRAFT_114556 [Armillaria gallica]
MQHGDMRYWPTCRKLEDRRFRLIDFGRSQYFPPRDTRKSFWNARAKKEWECQEVFKIINFQDWLALASRSVVVFAVIVVFVHRVSELLYTSRIEVCLYFPSPSSCILM